MLIIGQETVPSAIGSDLEFNQYCLKCTDPDRIKSTNCAQAGIQLTLQMVNLGLSTSLELIKASLRSNLYTGTQCNQCLMLQITSQILDLCQYNLSSCLQQGLNQTFNLGPVLRKWKRMQRSSIDQPGLIRGQLVTSMKHHWINLYKRSNRNAHVPADQLSDQRGLFERQPHTT